MTILKLTPHAPNTGSSSGDDQPETIANLTVEVSGLLAKVRSTLHRINEELEVLRTQAHVEATASITAFSCYANEDDLLTVEEVASKLHVSRVTLWKLRKTESFPRSIHVSERKIAFRSSDIDMWLKNSQR